MMNELHWIERQVSEALLASAVGCGQHDWAVEGGTIRLTTQELRPALMRAAAANYPDNNWTLFVEEEL